MVKLTVMYTLPERADHKAFLKWRTTEHQKENMGIPGVIKSDFYTIREIYTHKSAHTDKARDTKPEDRLEDEPLRYRYMMKHTGRI